MPPSLSTLSSTRYAIVVDAGSSGSRLQIYSWQDPEAERRQIVEEVTRRLRAGGIRSKIVVQHEVDKALRRLVKVEKGVEGENWIKRQEPGLSKQTPQTLESYLSPLIAHALDHIPPSQHPHTPIYILATAGMRLLPDHDCDALLHKTCEILRKDTPFIVDDASAYGPCGESVRVISGEEEGMWGWVAVNYLMDGFGHAQSPDIPPLEKDTLGFQQDVPPTMVDPYKHNPTFGFLDMGGASTQIAFSPTPEERRGFPEDQLEKVSLRLLSGQTVEWPVFVASWLGFGTNRAREKYEQNLLETWRIESQSLDSVIPTPATGDREHAVRDPCLPANLYIESSHPDKPSLLGTGSFAQCMRDLQPLLESTAPCPEPHEHCLFAGLPTPHIDFDNQDHRGFIGVSEYWYTTQQVLGLGGVWDWGEWEKGMSDFCGKNWDDLQNESVDVSYVSVDDQALACCTLD